MTDAIDAASKWGLPGLGGATFLTGLSPKIAGMLEIDRGGRAVLIVWGGTILVAGLLRTAASRSARVRHTVLTVVILTFGFMLFWLFSGFVPRALRAKT